MFLSKICKNLFTAVTRLCKAQEKRRKFVPLGTVLRSNYWIEFKDTHRRICALGTLTLLRLGFATAALRSQSERDIHVASTQCHHDVRTKHIISPAPLMLRRAKPPRSNPIVYALSSLRQSVRSFSRLAAVF